MRVPFIRGVVWAGALLLVLTSSAVRMEAAQPKVKPPPPPAKPPAARPQAGNRGGGAKPAPAEQLDRMLNMSPEEREKNLSKLPPAQRKQVQNQLDNLDRQNPAQRAQSLERLRQLEKLPPVRQQAVKKQIQSMNGVSVADQRQFLRSPEFAKSFSPEEQQIVRERFPAAASDVVRPTDRLAPARRTAVNQQVQSMNGLSVADQRQFLHSPEFAKNFSPDEQQIVRDRFPNAASDVVRPTDKLSPARRTAVNQERQRIQAMPFEQRRQALQSPEFNQNFSPEEQQILRDNFPNAAK